VEKRVAVDSYGGSLTQLYVAASVLALAMVLVQAGTGWKAGKDPEEGNESGNESEEERGIGVEDEEWEEGMEQGV